MEGEQDDSRMEREGIRVRQNEVFSAFQRKEESKSVYQGTHSNAYHTYIIFPR